MTKKIVAGLAVLFISSPLFSKTVYNCSCTYNKETAVSASGYRHTFEEAKKVAYNACLDWANHNRKPNGPGLCKVKTCRKGTI